MTAAAITRRPHDTDGPRHVIRVDGDATNRSPNTNRSYPPAALVLHGEFSICIMDRAVQKTDDDAASSKRSAVSKNYFKDEYLRFFVPTVAARLPLINIGTYCRVQGIEQLVSQFLKDTSASGRRAIVSLGAGSDTRPFHVLQKHAHVEYHELDFKARTTKKVRTIRTNEVLMKALGLDEAQNNNNETAEMHTDAYHLYPVDLRTLSKPSIDVPVPLQRLFEQQIPTLILSECCLCYMSPQDSDGVLSFFARHLRHDALSLAMYEPMALEDEFGRVMAENLAMRGLSLPTFRLYNTLEAQKRRLRDLLGAEYVDAVSVETVYDHWLDPQDHARVSRLEFLDEVEEMRLLMRHYCIAWARGRLP